MGQMMNSKPYMYESDIFFQV